MDLETRTSISGVKLTENLSVESPFLRHVQKSESLAYQKPHSMRLHPEKQTVSMVEDAHLVTLRNITRQMKDQNQHSKHISPETLDHILKFEKLNGLDKNAFLPDIPDKKQSDTVDKAEVRRRKKLMRTNPELLQQEDEQNAAREKERLEKQREIRLAKQFRNEFR